MKKELLRYERLFGLIGFPLSHSFSKRFFSEKFEKEGISGCYYELFPLESIDQLPALVQTYPNLRGLNITIPYKQAVLPFLDRLDGGARTVGAVNTIRIQEGRQEGFNTDVTGFERSLREWLEELGRNPGRALVLGTGGAARAVGYVLERMEIDYRLVSRRPAAGQLSYKEVDAAVLDRYPLLVNTTPLGMSPRSDTRPDLPYEQLGPGHLLYDLVYNPQKTLFLAAGEKQGCATFNGLEMLHLQAEAAWEIWNRT